MTLLPATLVSRIKHKACGRRLESHRHARPSTVHYEVISCWHLHWQAPLHIHMQTCMGTVLYCNARPDMHDVKASSAHAQGRQGLAHASTSSINHLFIQSRTWFFLTRLCSANCLGSTARFPTKGYALEALVPRGPIRCFGVQSVRPGSSPRIKEPTRDIPKRQGIHHHYSHCPRRTMSSGQGIFPSKQAS